MPIDVDAELEKTSQEIEDELNTMIDPYAIPAPWVIKYDRDDNMYYFNPETGARKVYRPDDVRLFINAAYVVLGVVIVLMIMCDRSGKKNCSAWKNWSRGEIKISLIIYTNCIY